MEKQHPMESIEERLKELAGSVFASQGFELIDASVKGGGGRRLLQLVADREGGITVDDCSRLSHALSSLLDQDGLFDSPYRLEISSPGLDRPLRSEGDFKRVLGRDVRVETTEKKQAIGRLSRVDQGRIWIETEDGTVDLPLPSVVNAKIKLKW